MINKTVLMGMLIATVALTAVSAAIPMSFADKPESDQDGWGEVTSELANSDEGEDEVNDEPGGLVGEHSRANGDFGDDGDSEPPFDNDDKAGRSGLGNVARALEDAELIEEGHPNDLGCFLAGADNNPDTEC